MPSNSSQARDEPSHFDVTQWLGENLELLGAANEQMNFGHLHDALEYQWQLHQNLLHLASFADEDENLRGIRFNPAGAAESQEQEEAAAQAQQGTGSASVAGGTTGAPRAPVPEEDLPDSTEMLESVLQRAEARAASGVRHAHPSQS